MKPSTAARTLALVAHGALIAGLSAYVGASAGLLFVLPLFVPLPGLLSARSYTFAWSTLLIVFYCGGLLAEAYVRPGDRLVLHALASVAALEFVALNLFVRFRSVEARRS